MIRRLFFIIAIVLTLTFIAGAQDESPEATAEVTAETLPESTALPNATPQARSTEHPDCPPFVANTLNAASNTCDNIGLNEACLANQQSEAVRYDGQSALENVGDIEALINLETIQLSALDFVTGDWGFLVIKALANITPDPDSDTPVTGLEDVQFVVFGETEIRDEREIATGTIVTATPVYDLPDINSTVLDELVEADTIRASARLEGGGWIRVFDLEEDSITLGWIPADSVQFDSDISALPELTTEAAFNPTQADTESRFGSMDVFSFQSAADDAPCSAAPDSGMLIQTPEGVASVTIVMDEVVIQLNGTASVQAQANGELQLDILDGAAQVTAEGDTRTVVEGQGVSVELDENGVAASVPSNPTASTLDTEGLPLDFLDDEVDVADPLDLPPGVPISGEWALTYGVDSLTCPDGATWTVGAEGNVAIQAQQDGLLYSGILYNSIGTGIYQGDYMVTPPGDQYTDTLQVGATDRITGATNIDFAERLCTLTVPFSLQLVNPS